MPVALTVSRAPQKSYDAGMLYGRDAERSLLGGLLDGARASRSAVLVIRGEPGAGKSALLDDARQAADGMTVLAARGIESEAQLPFAALHQLTRPALEHLGSSRPSCRCPAPGARPGGG